MLQLNSVRICVAVIITAVSVTASPTCPPGFVQNGSRCVCGDWPDEMVSCNNYTLTASMKIGYCMTYNNTTSEVKAGRCTRSCFMNETSKLYYPLPANVSDLNDRVCGPFNSKGQLCGECQDGFAVPPLSWHRCINCTSAASGWIKYIAAKYIPLTVLFMVIAIFSISIVSGPINSFIFFAQITVWAIDRYNFECVYLREIRGKPIGLVIDLYNAWNLNIDMGDLIPPFCLTNHFTKLQATALEYAIAFYPLTLVVLLYVCIKLHYQNFRPIVYCWKPLLKCFLRFRRRVQPKTSLIDAFATFLLLSYVNVIWVVGLFLLPQRLYMYNSHGKRLNTLVMATSPSIQYFHGEHLPLAVLSILISLTFIAVPPIVLVFYQVSCFQKCLTLCRMNTQALHTFVKTFQGCYKDGTNGTRDCRYFAGLYFILRIVAIVVIFGDFINESVIFYWCIALLFALVRPCNTHIYNVVDAVMFGLLGTIYFLCILNMEHIQSTGHFSIPLLVLIYILHTFPLVCFIVFIVYLVLDRNTSCIQKLKNHRLLRRFFQDHKKLQTENFSISATVAHWPDRLLNPEQYEELTDGNRFEYRELLRESSNTYRTI